MDKKWMIVSAITFAAIAGWLLSRDNVKTTVEDPPCVIWKHGLSVAPALDLDYFRMVDCQHIADMLNRDEYMTGTSPISTPTFVCRCR